MTDVLDRRPRARVKLAPDELPPASLWLRRRPRSVREEPVANNDSKILTDADLAALTEFARQQRGRGK